MTRQNPVERKTDHRLRGGDNILGIVCWQLRKQNRPNGHLYQMKGGPPSKAIPEMKRSHFCRQIEDDRIALHEREDRVTPYGEEKENLLLMTDSADT